MKPASTEYQKIRDHIGHAVVAVGYGQRGDGDYENVALECTDCGCIIADENRDPDDDGMVGPSQDEQQGSPGYDHAAGYHD